MMNIEKIEKINISMDGQEAYDLAIIIESYLSQRIEKHINNLGNTDYSQKVSTYNKQNHRHIRMMRTFFAVSPYNFGEEKEAKLLKQIKGEDYDR